MYRLQTALSLIGLLLVLLISAWTPAAGVESIPHSPVSTTWQVLHSTFHKYGITPYPEFIAGQSAAPRPGQPHASAQAAPKPVDMQCTSMGICSHVPAQQPVLGQGGLADSSAAAEAQQPPQLSHPTAQQHGQQGSLGAVVATPATPCLSAATTATGSAATEQPRLQSTAPAGTLTGSSVTPTLPTLTPAGAAPIPAPAPATSAPARHHRPPPVRRLLNLAELSDGASVLAANAEARRPERAIDRDIDSFMKNDCDAQKWMIIELSQLGTVETVKLTMKELYSSRVHTFRVFGRSTHPRKDSPDLTASLSSDAWQLLGSFAAENKRGTQSFSLPQRSRVRYLLLMFDTHYGNEQMCAMNWIEVLGVSAAQELEEALALQDIEAEHEENHQHGHVPHQQHQSSKHMQASQHQPPSQQEHAGGPTQQQPVQDQPQQHANMDLTGGSHAQADGSNTQVVAGDGRTPAAASQGSAGVAAPADAAVPVGSSQLHQTTVTHQQQQEPAREPVQARTGEGGDGTSKGHSQQLLAPDAQHAAAHGAQHAGQLLQGGPVTPSAPQDTTAVVGGQQQGALKDPAASAAANPSQQQQQFAAVEVPSGGPGPSGSIKAGSEAALLGVPAAPEPAATPAGMTGVQAGTVDGTASSGTDGGGQPAGAAVGSGTDKAAGQAATEDSARGADTQQTNPQHPHGQQQQQQGTQQQVAGSSTGAGSIDEQQRHLGLTEAVGAGHAVLPSTPAGAVPSPAAVADSMAGSHDSRSQQQPVVALQQQHQARTGPAGTSIGNGDGKPPVQQQQQQPVQTGPVGTAGGQQRDGSSVLDSRGSNKPKQAGNLFDVVKSEMMQLKLDQSKLSKKVDSLSKRSGDNEAAATALQQQQAALQAQVDRVSKRLDALAASQATAAAQQQQLRKDLSALLAAQKQERSRKGYGAGSRTQPGSTPGTGYGAGPETVVMQDTHLPVQTGSSMDTPGQPLLPPVCARVPADELPLLLQSRYQWSVVTALACTSLLGLWLVLHPKSLGLPQVLRLVVCVLALLNGILAVLLGLWLLVMQGLAAQQQQHQQAALLMTDPRLSVPVYRMLSNGSAWGDAPL